MRSHGIAGNRSNLLAPDTCLMLTVIPLVERWLNDEEIGGSLQQWVYLEYLWVYDMFMIPRHLLESKDKTQALTHPPNSPILARRLPLLHYGLLLHCPDQRRSRPCLHLQSPIPHQRRQDRPFR